MTLPPDADPRGGPGEEPTRPQDVVRGVFRRALRDVLAFLGILAALGIVVGLLVDGTAGLWGAVVGFGVAAVFSGTTIVVMLKTTRSTPTVLAAAVMGSWLVKMIVLIVVLIVLRDMDFYNKYVFGAVVFAGCVGAALLDYRAVAASRVPYVEPRS